MTDPPASSIRRRRRIPPLVLIMVLALIVRAAMGIMANGRGEMEGLARRYEEGAYAMAAGYGLIRTAEDGPRETDLLEVVDSLNTRGERLTSRNAPPITPARWRPSSLHPPAYSLFLLAIYRTLGPPVTAWARVIQAILDSAACLIVFAIGRQFAGRRVGLFAAACWAAFPPIAYLATSRVADAWSPMLFALTYWLYLRALDTRAARWWCAAGASLGVLWMFRPDFALLPVFLIAGALVAVPDLRRVVLGGAVLVLSTLVVILPWGLRNQRVHGHFTLGTTAAGMTLLQSVGQFPNPYGLGVDDGWYMREAQRHGYDSIDDPGADRLFRRRFMQIVRSNPGLVLGQALHRVPLALAPLYHNGVDNPFFAGHGFLDYLSREGLGPLAALRKHPVEVLLAYGDRLVFSLIGLVLTTSCIALAILERGSWRTLLLLFLPFLYVASTHLPLYMGSRFLVPALFCQFVALGRLWDRLHDPDVAPLWSPGDRSGTTGDPRGAAA